MTNLSQDLPKTFQDLPRPAKTSGDLWRTLRLGVSYGLPVKPLFWGIWGIGDLGDLGAIGIPHVLPFGYIHGHDVIPIFTPFTPFYPFTVYVVLVHPGSDPYFGPFWGVHFWTTTDRIWRTPILGPTDLRYLNTPPYIPDILHIDGHLLRLICILVYVP